jgi:hypothetical protein
VQKAIEDYLRRTATITDEQERLRHISTLADESASVFDLLMGLLTHQVTTLVPPPPGVRGSARGVSCACRLTCV